MADRTHLWRQSETTQASANRNYPVAISSIADITTPRRRLMDHVACAGNPMERALRNVRMQPARLLVDINQPVFLASDN